MSPFSGCVSVAPSAYLATSACILSNNLRCCNQGGELLPLPYGSVCKCFEVMMPISLQFMDARNNRAESLSRSRLANPNSSDFPVIRNIWGSSRPSPENPMPETTMPRGYSVSFLHPVPGQGKGQPVERGWLHRDLLEPSVAPPNP